MECLSCFLWFLFFIKKRMHAHETHFIQLRKNNWKYNEIFKLISPLINKQNRVCSDNYIEMIIKILQQTKLIANYFCSLVTKVYWRTGQGHIWTPSRNQLVSLADTPYYHVVSRCVRRAYLCGTDPLTGQNYAHRRQWIENRIRILSSLFAIDICAYAVMSNHLHLAVKICPQKLENLSNEEIVERWTSIFKGPLLVQRWRAGEVLDSAELQAVSESINVFRSKLGDLSWFMKWL